MIKGKKRRALLGAFGLVAMLGAYSCGSSDSTESSIPNPNGAPSGARCNGGNECASGACVSNTCVGDAPTTGGDTSPGPHYVGGGTGARPLKPGCGPETAGTCTGSCDPGTGSPSTIIRAPATLCFSGEGDVTPEDPAVVIEQVIEEIGGKRYVHLRVTFDPFFVDNTYGANACCGWENRAKGGMPAPDGTAKASHTFKDLVGSDHVELLFTDGTGTTVADFKFDYISEDASAPCGYRSLGVTGGEGKVITGDPAVVVAVSTSLDRNLNGCGYCLTTDSPATDISYTANPETPKWDYRVVYEIWLDYDKFGPSGFGQAYITSVHASPSKAAENTVDVEPSPCPPDWDVPYCPPSVIQEGGNCSDTPPDDGGAGCPPNYEIYVASEGASLCTPIPHSNYPGNTPCPAGYTLTERDGKQHCLPTIE